MKSFVGKAAPTLSNSMRSRSAATCHLASASSSHLSSPSHTSTRTTPWTHHDRQQPFSPPLSVHSISSSSFRHFASQATREATSPERLDDADIVVVGGGVVGLGLACGLTTLAFLSPGSITLVEASDLSKMRKWASDKQNSCGPSCPDSSHHDAIDWENRVISLTSENMQWLKDIGVHPYLVHHRLRTIHSMRIWDGLSGATLDFDSQQLLASASPSTSSSTAQISVMVEISNLQQAMLRFLEQGPHKGVCTIKDGFKVQRIVPGLDALDQSTTIQDRDPWPVVELASIGSPSSSSIVRGRLLVGADGPNSPVRKYAGISHSGWPYNRKGLVATLRCTGTDKGEPLVGHTAWQRFLPSGTIAFLPLSDHTGSMVWTLAPEVAEALAILHRDTADSDVQQQPLARLIDAGFRLPWAHLERLFEQVVAFSKLEPAQAQSRDWSWLVNAIPSEAQFIDHGSQPLPESSTGDVPPKVQSVDLKSVASFPLQLKHADAYLGSSLNGSGFLPSSLLAGTLSLVGLASEGAGQGNGRARTALVGDAAHTIHPLAGQGLNLGIADVRSLANVIAKAQQSGADLGSYSALKQYPRDRYWENQKMLSAVDHLHWLYAGLPVPLSQQADGGRMAMQRDGIFKTIAKEGIAQGTVWARTTGLEVINELGFVKNAFMRQAGSTTTHTSGSRPDPVGQTRSFSTSSKVLSGKLSAFPRFQQQVRHHSSAKSLGGEPLASDAYTEASGSDPATTGTPSLASLTPDQRRALSDMLRVDHSGEVAANTIYEAQANVFGALGDIKNRDMMREMWSTEKKHLQVMRVLLRQHNVRPSALLPVWAVAGRVLGGVTALLGPRSAMACTEAVESVIGEHYNDQLKALSSILSKTQVESRTKAETSNEEVHPSLPLLADIIQEFRDDELEHLDIAIENESQQAAAHALLSAVIATGCRGAIWVTAKV